MAARDETVRDEGSFDHRDFTIICQVVVAPDGTESGRFTIYDPAGLIGPPVQFATADQASARVDELIGMNVRPPDAAGPAALHEQRADAAMKRAFGLWVALVAIVLALLAAFDCSS